MTKPIVCYGDLVADLVLQIPRLPILPDQAQLARSLTIEPGGAGNSLITAARLGAHCIALGAIGVDPNGQTIYQILKDEGIDLAFVQRGANSVNVVVFVFVDDAGQHVFIAHDGTGNPYAIGTPEADCIRAAGVFFVPGYALAEQRMSHAAISAIQIAYAANVPIFSDLGPIVRDVHVRDAALEVVRHSHISLLTAEEAMAFTHQTTETTAAQELLRIGSRFVILKRGALGCGIFSADGTVDIEGIRVETKDTTGAGDTFAGGFCVDWLKHRDVVRAARFANVVAAAKVDKRSAVADNAPPQSKWKPC